MAFRGESNGIALRDTMPAKRPRWADICDSNEDVGSLLLPCAPVIDSQISYMEVGGSRSDLTRQVQEALDLKGTAASSNGGGEDDGEEDKFVPLSDTRRKRSRDEISRGDDIIPDVVGNEPMPEVTEEVHQVRTAKRWHALVTIKAKPEYMDFCLSRLDVQPCTLTRTVTPDAEDRTLSKRQWEAAVMRWRSALRQGPVAGVNDPSVRAASLVVAAN